MDRLDHVPHLRLLGPCVNPTRGQFATRRPAKFGIENGAAMAFNRMVASLRRSRYH
jgi:hypothetical protein